MTRTTGILLATLLASLLVNVLVVRRLSQTRAELERNRRESRAATSHRGSTADPDVAVATPAPEPARPEAPSSRAATAGAVSADPARDPRIARALSEEESASAFWGTLSRLARGHASMKPEEYRSLVCDTTADFLGGDRASFASAAQQMLIEVESAEKAYQIEWGKLWPLIQDDAAGAYDAQAVALTECRDRAVEAARSRLAALLAAVDEARRRRFLSELPKWERCMRSPEFVRRDDR